jgi:hypothetical protein
MANTPLDEFKSLPLAVRIWSKRLKREIWLVSNEQAVREFGIEGIYFTGDELKGLSKRNPTVNELKTLVDIKAILGGEIVEFPERKDEDPAHE